MQNISKNWSILILGILFVAISGFFIYTDNWYFFFVAPALVLIYIALYQTKYLFLSLFLLTPLSINIEEYVDGFGLFLPTEPILFGLFLLLLIHQLSKPTIPSFVFKNEIVWALAIYLIWLCISTMMSSDSVVSLKFIIAKCWFILPMIGFGSIYFQNTKAIRQFIWLFCIGMVIVIIYTVINHATYQFGEKESHWVMWPFFKDHTIYGAMVAFVLPLIAGLYFSKKHKPLIQAILIGMFVINLVGLYFSYTRAAWLSIIGAVGVLWLIVFKIKFRYIAFTTLFLGTILYASWTSIQFALEKNKEEHTTEDFGKRLQSSTNVTTDASNLERINRWSCAIDMFNERPFFGFGPGTYAFEYGRFQDPKNLTIISTNFGDGGNAHSEYLGPLAETGVIGLATVLLLIGIIFYKSITLYIAYDKKENENKTLLLAMILSLVTYFIHGILNNYLDTDKASVPIFAICACIIVLEKRMKDASVAHE